MRYEVWIEQTINRATVVAVDANTPEEAESLAAMAAESFPWTHVEVTRQDAEVRPSVNT